MAMGSQCRTFQNQVDSHDQIELRKLRDYSTFVFGIEHYNKEYHLFDSIKWIAKFIHILWTVYVHGLYGRFCFLLVPQILTLTFHLPKNT